MLMTLDIFFENTELLYADLWEVKPLISENQSINKNQLDKEKWLEVCRRINKKINGFSINHIFFIKENPISIFVKIEDIAISTHIVFNIIWNLARPRFLFIEKEGEIEVHDLGTKPSEENKKLAPITILRNVSDCLKYHRSIQESENLFLDKRLASQKQTADISLIADLKELRKILTGKSRDFVLQEGEALKDDQAHALIGQTIFIRYLEDRNILNRDYFEKIALQDKIATKEWQAILNDEIDKSNLLNPEMADKFFTKILSNRNFAITFFQTLSADLNGDIFLKNENYDFLQQKHLDLIQQFLLAKIEQQQKLWLWAYKFDIIPLELISSIYEEFYHKDVEKEGDAKGTHYTPSSLVDFILSQTLTVERLKNSPRILDPACGSGIFLVESFRRIVRYKRLFESFVPNFENLNAIIKAQISGIELNERAAKITAFSLYIALLDFLDPPYIQNYISEGKKLPYFLYQQEYSERHLNIILPQNAFWVEDLFKNDKGLENFQPNTVDVIVGNPPWGSADKKNQDDKDAIKWCESRNYPISDSERSQMFIWRSFELLRENGIAALLVSSGILFKSSEGSNDFKKQWASKSSILSIFNFVHTRHVFFSSAISPFVGVIFQKKQPPRNHIIRYWTFLYTRRIAKTQAIVLDKTCFKQIPQSYTNVSDIWKINYFGNMRDYALISGMRLYPTLEELEKKETGKIPRRQGFIVGKNTKEQKNFMWLEDFGELPTISFNKKYGSINLKLIPIPTNITRSGQAEYYQGLRILFKAGITTKDIFPKGQIIVRLHDETFAFRDSINCFKLQNEEEANYKFILGILWSSLSRYYYFMVNSKWGVWRDDIKPDIMMSLPIMETDSENAEYQSRIISIVDKLRNGELPESNLFSENKYTKTQEALEAELDEVVFEFYYFSDAEKDLIRDRCKYDIDFYYNREKSIAVKPIHFPSSYMCGKTADIQRKEGIENYLHTFHQVFTPYIKQGKTLYFEVIRSYNINWHTENMSDMICVVFSFSEAHHNSQTTYKEWEEVITEIENIQQTSISDAIYVDNFLRILTPDFIFIIKRNEQRLWTRTAAREDVEAIFAKSIRLSHKENERI